MKAFLTGSFLNPFHIREYYNGIPLVNKSMSFLNEGINVYLTNKIKYKF